MKSYKVNTQNFALVVLMVFLLAGLAIHSSANNTFTNTTHMKSQNTRKTINKSNQYSKSTYTPHANIVITSNADFTNSGLPGTGSISDPIIIENYSFNVTLSHIAIDISGTTFYFIIRNNYFLLEKGAAVDISKVKNGVVENNIIVASSSSTSAFSASDYSSNMVITNNQISNVGNAIYCNYGSNYTISGNQITNTKGDAIYAYHSDNFQIDHNTLTGGNATGIYIFDSDNFIVEINEISSFKLSYALKVSLDTSNSNIIRYNNFIDNSLGNSQAWDTGTNSLFTLNYWNELTIVDANNNTINDTPYSIAGGQQTQDIFPRTIAYDLASFTTDQLPYLPNTAQSNNVQSNTGGSTSSSSNSAKNSVTNSGSTLFGFDYQTLAIIGGIVLVVIIIMGLAFRPHSSGKDKNNKSNSSRATSHQPASTNQSTVQKVRPTAMAAPPASQKARSLGFTSDKEMEMSMSLGFGTKKELESAFIAGFANRTEVDEARRLGVATKDEMQKKKLLVAIQEMQKVFGDNIMYTDLVKRVDYDLDQLHEALTDLIATGIISARIDTKGTLSHEDDIIMLHTSRPISTEASVREGTDQRLIDIGKSADVFISFSSQDTDTAEALFFKILEDGMQAWISTQSIDIGANYSLQILDAIDNAKYFILLLTEDSMTSRHVQAELERAFSNDIDILPIKLDDHPIPKAWEYFLSTSQYKDVRRQGMDQWIAELSSQLKDKLGESLSDVISDLIDSYKIKKGKQ